AGGQQDLFPSPRPSKRESIVAPGSLPDTEVKILSQFDIQGEDIDRKEKETGAGTLASSSP
ncbi:hypothetical protein KIPB_012354, partial [Kipferlia bialata]